MKEREIDGDMVRENERKRESKSKTAHIARIFSLINLIHHSINYWLWRHCSLAPSKYFGATREYFSLLKSGNITPSRHHMVRGVFYAQWNNNPCYYSTILCGMLAFARKHNDFVVDCTVTFVLAAVLLH